MTDTLHLARFAYTPMGTFGRIAIGGQELYTVERPWLRNIASKSCVPVGEYELEPHSSAKYPDTWALVGDTVSHYPEPGKVRSAILFHAGNTMDDLLGCIAPGLALGTIYGKWGVTRSRDAMRILRAAQPKRLIISNYDGGKL